MEKESTDAGADTVLWGITKDEILKAIDEIDEEDNENGMEATTEGDTAAGLSLQELRDKVHMTVETALEKMKESLTAGRGDIDLYLRLNDALLAFQHWSNDIIVQKENPLAAIEQDKSDKEFGMLVVRLRAYFVEMLGILAEFE